ncbi:MULTISPECIES: hypothetical protein [Paenibacillus]|uniref:hypothetical protein n=1 Tax=Paenibacillus TaxID=44249 RepID=UPI00187B336C|nr:MULTISPECIES: hypothetical protein [Paenibacillus]MBE7682003.1 hypothetical protein [Paenibacillus sp. P13VS]MBY0216560.1 hypothetical protein [Paenibacillus illinoisensis]
MKRITSHKPVIHPHSHAPGRKNRTTTGHKRRTGHAYIRGLAVPDKTSSQFSTDDAQRGLDQLALIAAILALIAAVIGVYIAWKTLLIPGDSNTVVAV